MEGEILSTKINELLARYRLFVQNENQGNRYNINNSAESFFIPILKIVFECPGLCNLNMEKNFPALDLGDKERRIAFQVTATTNSKKGC